MTQLISLLLSMLVILPVAAYQQQGHIVKFKSQNKGFSPQNDHYIADLKKLSNKSKHLIEYVEPNDIYHKFTDKKFPYQWAIFNYLQFEGYFPIDLAAQKRWEISRGDKDITIAILDTGIDYTHQDLQGQIFVNQQEREGQVGVDDDKNGGGLSHVLEAIDYALSMNAKILSNSWASEDDAEFLKEYIQKAGEAGAKFIRAVISSYDLDTDFDFLTIRVPTSYVQQESVDEITGDLKLKSWSISIETTSL